VAKPYKILVVAPSWIGDMVMSQTLLKLLKAQYHDNCQIDVLVNDWARDVAMRMPEVTKVHLNPFKHGELALGQRIALGRRLRHEHYDQAFVLPNSWKSALIPFMAAIKRRTGFIGEVRYGLLNDFYRLDKQALPLMVDRFCALANHGQKPSSIPYPQFTIQPAAQHELVANLQLDLTKPLVCLCPAAEYGPAKRWPTASFAKLSQLLIAAGFQVWLMGSAKDRAISQEIVAKATPQPDLIDLCGKTSLVAAFDLLALAKVVVTNDSGLMHVACAVGTKVVAIYGSSSPNFTPPLSDQARILQLEGLSCAPCFARTCKFGHYNCLTGISEELVVTHVRALSSD
jgi:heptosyltransferase-2